MATIYDVAKAAGVSISTVSHVLNGTRFVSDETKARVHQAVQQLGFRPSSLARAMVRQETHSIALIVPDNVNPFFAELARGIDNYGFQSGYNVFLCNSDHSLTKEQAYLEMLVSKRIDGLIYMTEDFHTSQLKPLLSHHIPIVVFDREYEGLDAVLQDNFKGGHDATRHLIELGHRRIACISGPDMFRSRDRVNGYEAALREAGIEPDPALIMMGDWTFESGVKAAAEILKLAPQPTGIFVSNDMMAVGVMSYLYQMNLNIPKDMSIVGYDNVSLSAYTSPPLTTFAISIRKMGECLCQVLLDRINGKPPAEPQRLVVQGELLVRQSSGVPKVV